MSEEMTTQWSVLKEPVRFAMVGSLLYATYLVAWCPCPTPVGCKQGSFYAAVMIPAAATFLLNLSPDGRK
jgi:hypothetical protein